MFNLFKKLANRNQSFTILARYSSGCWFKSFTVEAPSAYLACRKFDTADNRDWVRVSGASLKTEYRNY